ncbi:MAG: hypothetical protein WBZ19_18600, partial [Chthoniobacterales bacterium]
RAPRGRATNQRCISVRDREHVLAFGQNPAAAGRGGDPSRRWALHTIQERSAWPVASRCYLLF